MTRQCRCGKAAEVYAGGRHAGDWADYYCVDHIPTGFHVFDDLRNRTA